MGFDCTIVWFGLGLYVLVCYFKLLDLMVVFVCLFACGCLLGLGFGSLVTYLMFVCVCIFVGFCLTCLLVVCLVVVSCCVPCVCC